MSEERKDLTITDDLKPVLEMLKPSDASAVVELREELADNWQKKQIFRTETEMRISVLNDAKHPTNASKYWQSVREQGAMFDALLGLTFDLRRNKLARRRLEQEQKEESIVTNESATVINRSIRISSQEQMNQSMCISLREQMYLFTSEQMYLFTIALGRQQKR